MARTSRKSKPTVKDIFLSEPYRFEFHQAIKILEYMNPHAVPFGETVNPEEEVVQVKSRVYLESLASDIYSLENTETPSSSQSYSVLNVNFMGVAGIQGPLPFPYTEMIIQRLRHKDSSLKDFLDIFNHRLIAILHRLRKQILLSLNTKSPETTEIATGLKSFIGIELPDLKNRLAVPDRALLNYAGLYWSRPRSAQGLESILRSYFRIPLHVEKCVGRWRDIDPDHQTRIGHRGQWQTLGKGAALGKRAWDQEMHFLLHLGPLNAENLEAFLPNGGAFQRLTDLIRLYVGPMMDFDIKYVVSNPPSTILKQGSYLGWRSWLGASLVTGDSVRVEETSRT